MSTAKIFGSSGPHQPKDGNSPVSGKAPVSPSPLKRTGALALATAIAFGGVGAVVIQGVQGLAAPAAQAADAPGTHLFGVTIQAPPPGGTGDWSMWLGSVVNPNGPGNGFCFEMGADAGFTPGVEGTASIPWLNKAILDNQANTSNHPALAYLTHEALDPRFNKPWDGTGTPYPDLKNSTDPQLVAIRAQAAQIKAAAQATAGPYTIQPKLSMPDQRTGTVTNTSAISAAGNPVNGLTATATLTNAVWDTTGTATVSFKTGGTLPGFTAVASGPVNVKVTATGAAATVTTITIPDKQDVLTAGGTTTFSGVSEDVTAALDFQPVATSTAPTYVEAGQALSDVLHVKTSDGLPWLAPNGEDVPAVFDVTWYYSPVALPAGASIPASAVKVASGTGTATGPGDVTVKADKAAGKDGHYYPVASFKKASQPVNLQQYFTGDWEAGFNDPGEHTIRKYNPKVTTKASVIEDGKVYDVITVTGNEPGKELTVATDLVLTSEAAVDGGTDQAPADAKIIGTVTTKVTGNGEFKTPAVAVPWEAILTEKWGKDLAANLYFSEKIQPTDTTNGWDGKERLPGETIPVEKPKVTTQASENGTVPVTATDKATVTGTIPTGPGVSTGLDWKLFKFGDDITNSVQALCQNEFWASKATVDVTKAGEYISEPVTLTDKGTYGYIETLTVKYTDSNGKIKTAVLHQGKCGETSETVVVFPKGVTPSPDKPQLHTPDQPAPVAPVAYTGEVTAQQGINTPLLFGGAAVLVAMIVIGASVYVQRRKVAAMNTAGEESGNPDELL